MNHSLQHSRHREVVRPLTKVLAQYLFILNNNKSPETYYGLGRLFNLEESMKLDYLS